jgi:hypothetical protein
MKTLLTLSLIIFLALTAIAQWPSNKNTPILVEGSPGLQEIVLQTMTDESGGIFVLSRRGSFGDLWLAHYNSQGIYTFNSPVYVSPGGQDEWLVGIISDGANGAIIAWADQRTNPNCIGGCSREIYGQHFGADGIKMWPQEGKLLFTGLMQPDHTQLGMGKLLNGGNGNFYALWEEKATCGALEGSCPNTTNRIMIQKYDEEGDGVWAGPQVVYSSTDRDEWFTFDAKYDPGTDRVFTVWQDSRANTTVYPITGYTANITNFDLYAQAIDGVDGEQAWTNPEGILVNNFVDTSYPFGRMPNPKIAFDQEGVVITWVDYRVHNQKSIYGTRLRKTSGSRFPSWVSTGELLSSHQVGDLIFVPDYYMEYEVSYDLKELPGNTFMLAYPGAGNVLYAEKFNTSDAILWTTAISNDNTAFNGYPTILSNENEPAVVWVKSLATNQPPPGVIPNYSSAIYAQKFNSDGSLQWPTPVQLNNNIPHQLHFQASTHEGNVFVAWSEPSPGLANFDVKMTALSPAGNFKGGLTLIVGNHVGAKGQSVSIPVTVRDFQDILTLQTSIQWNHAVASFVGLSDFGIAGLDINSFGLTNTATGSLALSWDDETSSGQNLPNDAVLFAITFELDGNPGEETNITFTNSPVAIEAYYENGFEQAGVKLTNGFIQIEAYALTISTYYLTGNQPGEASGAIPGTDIFIDEDLYGVTEESGTVVIEALPDPEGVVQNLIPQKTDAGKSGVDVADIVMTRDHIVGKSPLPSPYSIIAADVDGNGIVSTVDMARIRAFILGKLNTFNGKTWTFVNDCEFLDASERYNMSTSPFTYLDHLQMDYTVLDIDELLTPDAIKFVGLKLGDLNASWAEESGDMNGRVKTDASLTLTAIQSQSKSPEAPFEISLVSPMIENLAGIQFTLEWDPQQWTYNGISGSYIPFALNEDNVADGYLTVLWHGTNETSVSLLAGTELLKLSFVRIGESGTLELTSSITRALAIDENLQRTELLMTHFVSEKEEATGKGVYPNPFVDQLNVNFSTTRDADVSFELINTVGNLVHHETSSFSKGMHEHPLNTAGLHKGMYLLRLTVEGKERIVKVLKY